MLYYPGDMKEQGNHSNVEGIYRDSNKNVFFT